MSNREEYTPGPAAGAEIQKDGEKWTLVLVRDLPHPPAKVWQALTDPEQLREWAPFDSDRNLGAVPLWHNINRGFIAMGAAGWHICFDVLDRLLAGHPIGRTAGPEVMEFDGWQRLNAEYAKQFGVETPSKP